MLKVNIICVHNEFGISWDVQLLKKVLEASGCMVTVSGPSQKRKEGKSHTKLSPKRILKFGYNKLLSTLTNKRPVDVNIFIERMWPEWFQFAKINCLVPNQEWFSREEVNKLKAIDLILCKTQLAQSIFQKYANIFFCSFTSQDRYRKKYSKNYDNFLHVAGGSLQKGTHRIIEAWKKHPEWPMLTIVQHPRIAVESEVANINFITEYLDDKTLLELQNTHGVHLCPSRAEGFGHYINEAMSCKALVLTTDAPPMNELVDKERGILVDYFFSDPNHMNHVGLNYYFNADDFENKINDILRLSDDQKEEYGAKARAWFNGNDEFFRDQMTSLVQQLVSRLITQEKNHKTAAELDLSSL